MTVLVDPADVGPVIRAARTAKGWTQHHLADRCAIKSSYIMLLENGRRGHGTSLGVILTVLAELDLSLMVVAAGRPATERTVASLCHWVGGCDKELSKEDGSLLCAFHRAPDGLVA